jgi:hypothetical protein
MKKLLAVLVAVSVASPAFAWGDREQGILTGVAGLWIFQQLNKPPVVVQQAPVVVQQQPVIVQQAPVVVHQAQKYCESKPVQNQFGDWQLVQFCYYK